MFFQNITGDKQLEWLQKGLTEVLIRALSQSRSLSVLSTDRLYEILKRLEQSPSSPKIDMDLAAIVAREANVKAIFSMVDQITQKIKEDLQLSLEKAQPLKGIEDISTHSLEAWRYYSDGNELMNKLPWVDARQLFELAPGLDSTFISARVNPGN